MIMSILSWIVVGLIVGLIARLILPGPQPIGFIPTIAVGIGGALLGGFVSWALTGAPEAPFEAYAWPGWILSIIGATVVLWLFTRRRRRPLRRGRST